MKSETAELKVGLSFTLCDLKTTPIDSKCLIVIMLFTGDFDLIS